MTGEQLNEVSTPPPAVFDLPAVSTPQVVIGSITRGEVRVEYLQGLLASQLHPWVESIIVVPYGPYLDDGRNELVTQYLATSTAPYLLMVDDDIGFDISHVIQIVGIARALGITGLLSGAYRTKRAAPDGTIGEYIVAGHKDPETGAHELMTTDYFASIPTPLLRVDGAGCGFLLIPRALLETMQDVSLLAALRDGLPGDICPWFREPIIGGLHLGEDYAFCDRATFLGYPIHLVPGVTLSHVKTVALTI